MKIFVTIFLFVICAFPDLARAADKECRVLDGNVSGQAAELCIDFSAEKGKGAMFFFSDPHKKINVVVGQREKNKYHLVSLDAGPKIELNGEYDPENMIFSGKYTEEKSAPKEFYFYDIRGLSINVKTEKKEHVTCSEDFTSENNYAETSYSDEWYVVTTNSKSEPLGNLIEKLNGSALPEKEVRKAAKAEVDCKKLDPKVQESAAKYDDNSSAVLRRVGSFLLVEETDLNAFTGGAHGLESGKAKIYDLRTFREISFSSLLTKEGQNLFLQHIKDDLCAEGYEGKQCTLSDCDFQIDKVWSFGEEKESYIPWRKETYPDAKKEISPLQKWNVSYGTYAFGCSGRPGYEMYGIPEDIVTKGLNPVYFDPETRFFY